MDTSKLREAILDKAREEADRILADAETKSREIVKKAEDQFRERVESEKKKILSEARRESAKRVAQASLEGRQSILREKDRIIGDILDKVRASLKETSLEEGNLRKLVRETIEAFESDVPVRLYGAPGTCRPSRPLSRRTATWGNGSSTSAKRRGSAESWPRRKTAW